MIIEWKETRLLVVPAAKGEGNETVSGHAIRKIFPGFNEIEPSVWEALLKQKSIARLNLAGKLQVVKPKEKKVEIEMKDKKGKKEKIELAADGANLDELADAELKEIIAKCNSVETLENWLTLTEKDSTRVLIQKQIGELNKE